MKKILSLLLGVSAAFAAGAQPVPASDSVTGYSSIQEAIDKNPGKVLFVPSGTYEINDTLRISSDNSGLSGPGHIVQTNIEKDILAITDAANVTVRDVTLLRPEGKTDTLMSGINARKCPGLSIDNVSVLENRTRGVVIQLTNCDNSRIINSLVQDYMRIAEEDRTKKRGQGYVFNTINGTGIDMRGCVGALIQGTRVLEFNYKPTEELKQKYELGKLVRKNPVKGELISQQIWDSNYNNAWHQGAAIHIGLSEVSDYVRILGNYVENAAQGIDCQSDHVVIANNIVNNAFIGMKAIHGSRNIIITGNQFSKNDLWSINVSPGSSSHPAGFAGPDGKPGAANIDGHSIIANNIISDFGYGWARWMWRDNGCYPIRFDAGPAPENPPISSVLIQGNIVYDTGKDQILVDGKPQVEPPHFKYAVFVEQGPKGAVDLHFANNILDPGTDGISNVDLKP